MFHPFEKGVFRQETHHPRVQVFRKAGLVKITVLVVARSLQELQELLPHE